VDTAGVYPYPIPTFLTLAAPSAVNEDPLGSGPRFLTVALEG
jgi:hypothetical protein